MLQKLRIIAFEYCRHILSTEKRRAQPPGDPPIEHCNALLRSQKGQRSNLKTKSGRTAWHNIINCTTWRNCLVAFIWMVAFDSGPKVRPCYHRLNGNDKPEIKTLKRWGRVSKTFLPIKARGNVVFRSIVFVWPFYVACWSAIIKFKVARTLMYNLGRFNFAFCEI